MIAMSSGRVEDRSAGSADAMRDSSDSVNAAARLPEGEEQPLRQLGEPFAMPPHHGVEFESVGAD
jgi:hypothetical protein